MNEKTSGEGTKIMQYINAEVIAAKDRQSPRLAQNGPWDASQEVVDAEVTLLREYWVDLLLD